MRLVNPLSVQDFGPISRIVDNRPYNRTVIVEWRPFDHVTIDHKSLTAREEWENSKHRSL